MTTEERMKRLEELAERGHSSTDDTFWLLQRLKETREALSDMIPEYPTDSPSKEEIQRAKRILEE